MESPSPSRKGRSLIDATERELSPSQFPALAATPSNGATTPLPGIAGRGSVGENHHPSRIPRASFWPRGQGSPAPRRVQYLTRVAGSPGRPYTPPPASYSTVRPVRGSMASLPSVTSTPHQQLASHMAVRSLSSAKLVDIPKTGVRPQPVERISEGVEGGDVLGMAAAPAPTIPTHSEGERGRRGLFQGTKSKVCERAIPILIIADWASQQRRSKSRSRAVLERVSGLVHRKRDAAPPPPRPVISAPVEGTFKHNALSEDFNSNKDSTATMLALPPLPALPLLPDRPPPPSPPPTPAMPASQPTNAAPTRTATPPALDSDDNMEPPADEESEDIGANLLLASEHFRSLADRRADPQAKAGLMTLAKV